jgi:hypothetical protein
MDLSLKIMTDAAISHLSWKGDEFIKGKADLIHQGAALILTSFYDYASYLMNTRQIDEDFVATSVKCRIVTWDANVLIFRTSLSPATEDWAVRITNQGPNATAYYERLNGHLPCPWMAPPPCRRAGARRDRLTTNHHTKSTIGGFGRALVVTKECSE